MSPLLLTSSIDRLKLFSTIKSAEVNSNTVSKIKRIFSWKNTKEAFNSLKFVDIKFIKKDNKTPKQETTSIFNPEPVLFIMPEVIRKRFENFNNEDIQKPRNKPNNVETPQLDDKLHQFLPEHSFMNQVVNFRNSAISSKLVKSNETKGLIGYLKNFIIGKKADKSTEPIFNVKMKVNLGRKISLLGFHGWFPTKLVQKVIGDPRRTSSRVVDMLETAILESEPLPPFLEGPASIYKFPLQGEGTIEERVEKHFDELQKIVDIYSHEGMSSIDHLKESDTIILAAHSQGAPVAIILLAKLLDAGIVNPGKQNITVLTVAGIFHGPFPPLRKNLVVQYVEADAARQLFDLNDPDSKVSHLLAESLNKVLQSGINITCVASWLDQVVPFYSACLLGFEHPNIWRSVHINADHYRPDFLTKLVDVGLKIKNTLPGFGEPETHMILSQVSDYISGSIYQHATHSSAYRKIDSYKTAVEWMKLGPNTKNIPIQAVDHVRHRPLQATVNPYYLPWLFRGWLNNPDLLSNPLTSQEIVDLQKMYQNWKPESKLLKDFKFKLEPISLLSKL